MLCTFIQTVYRLEYQIEETKINDEIVFTRLRHEMSTERIKLN